MKVAICTPSHGDLKVGFVVSLLALIKHTEEARPDIEVRFLCLTTSLIPTGRNALALEARKNGSDYILWIDSDQTFPPDTLLRLLAHKLPVVGANIPRRTPPWEPTAERLNGNIAETVWTTEEAAKSGFVEPVHRMGLGLLLVDVAVTARLPRPLFTVSVDENKRMAGEDYYFCGLLRQRGIRPHVDHALSWEVGHIGEWTVTHRDAIIARGLNEGTIQPPAGPQ